MYIKELGLGHHWAHKFLCTSWYWAAEMHSVAWKVEAHSWQFLSQSLIPWRNDDIPNGRRDSIDFQGFLLSRCGNNKWPIYIRHILEGLIYIYIHIYIYVCVCVYAWIQISLEISYGVELTPSASWFSKWFVTGSMTIHYLKQRWPSSPMYIWYLASMS